VENGALVNPPLEKPQCEFSLIHFTLIADNYLVGEQPITAFHQACHNNSIEMVSLFLAKGIDINLRGDKNKIALHYAASNPNPSLPFFEFMLNKGADPNLLSDKSKKGGRTVLAAFLHPGTWRGFESKRMIFEFLLDHGADVRLELQCNLLAGLFKYHPLLFWIIK